VGASKGLLSGDGARGASHDGGGGGGGDGEGWGSHGHGSVRDGHGGGGVGDDGLLDGDGRRGGQDSAAEVADSDGAESETAESETAEAKAETRGDDGSSDAEETAGLGEHHGGGNSQEGDGLTKEDSLLTCKPPIFFVLT